jgi:hypothetical protein
MAKQIDAMLLGDTRGSGDLRLAIRQLIEPLRIDRLRRGQDEFHRVDTDGNHVVAELLHLIDALAITLTVAIDGALEG